MKLTAHRCAALAGVLALSSVALAAWPSDPLVNLPVAVKPAEQSVEKAATMPDGTTWIGWFDNSGGSYAVYVQRLSPDGTATFPASGLLVSNNPQSTSLVDWDLTVDGDGNCFLAFTDTRDGGDLDVYAYLISPSGSMLWGANGVPVSAPGNSDYEADPRVLVSSAGEYLVAWPRFGSTAPGVWLQRLSAGGAAELPMGGVRIAGTPPEAPAFNEWVRTSDGFIMMWQRDTRTFSSPRHVRGQKFDSSGVAQWNAGTPLEISNGNVVPIAHKLRIISDGNDGAAMAWHDVRLGDFNAWVQHVDDSGGIKFALGGAQCSTTGSLQDLEPAIAFVPGSDDLMAFFDARTASQGDRALKVQRFDALGNRQLSDDGVTLSPLSVDAKSFIRAQASADGATCAWIEGVGGSPVNSNVRAIRVDEDGVPMWTTGVSTALVSRGRLLLTADAGGVMRAVWQDQRNDNGDIFAQRINANGSLGQPASCPGDANGDNSVNSADLSVLLSQFGLSVSPAGSGADYNADGVVNAADLSVLLANFGSSC